MQLNGESRPLLHSLLILLFVAVHCRLATAEEDRPELSRRRLSRPFSAWDANSYDGATFGAGSYAFALTGYVAFLFVGCALLWPSLYGSYRLDALKKRYLDGDRISGKVLDRASMEVTQILSKLGKGTLRCPWRTRRHEYITFVSYEVEGGVKRILKPLSHLTQDTYDAALETKTIPLIKIPDLPKSAIPREHLDEGGFGRGRYCRRACGGLISLLPAAYCSFPVVLGGRAFLGAVKGWLVFGGVTFAVLVLSFCLCWYTTRRECWKLTDGGAKMMLRSRKQGGRATNVDTRPASESTPPTEIESSERPPPPAPMTHVSILQWEFDPEASFGGDRDDIDTAYACSFSGNPPPSVPWARVIAASPA